MHKEAGVKMVDMLGNQVTQVARSRRSCQKSATASEGSRINSKPNLNMNG